MTLSRATRPCAFSNHREWSCSRAFVLQWWLVSQRERGDASQREMTWLSTATMAEYSWRWKQNELMDGWDGARCNMDMISWHDKSQRERVAKCNMKSLIFCICFITPAICCSWVCVCFSGFCLLLERRRWSHLSGGRWQPERAISPNSVVFWMRDVINNLNWTLSQYQIFNYLWLQR